MSGQDDAQSFGDQGLAWFFAIVIALSIPLWLLGSFGAFILPGLPISALSAFVPAVAASAVIARARGLGGLRRFWFRLRVRPRLTWLVLAAVTPVVLAVLSFALMRALGRDVPPPEVGALQVIGLLALFLPAAIGEEMGWSGFAATPLTLRFGALGAAIVCGGFEAAWHLLPLLQAERSAAWIGWWAVGTIASRIVMFDFLRRSGRAVHAPIAFHTMSNVSWMAFPVLGSHFDPQIHAGLLVAVCAVLAAVGTVENGE